MEAAVVKKRGTVNGQSSMSTIGEVFTPNRPRISPAEKPKLPFIGMEHVEAHTMKLLGTVPAGTMKSSSVHFQPGDVLYGRLRPYLNKVYRPDFEGLCSAEFIVFPETEGIDTRYLQYFLNSYDFVTFASRLNEGDRPRVDFKQISPYPFPLAPLPQQRRIVEAIELQLGRLDAAVARLHAAKARLKRYKQAVLKAAVEGRLLYPDTEEGELPHGWSVVPVEAVGQIVTGSTPSKRVLAYYGNEHPFYKPTDLDAGYETTGSTDGLTTAGLAEARALPVKSILVTCIGATIGKTGLIRTPGACNQQINAIVPNEHLVPEYGYFHCIAPYFQKQIKDNASATTLPLLNKNRFKVLDFILPTKSDQLRIVKEIEARLRAEDATDSTLDAQLQQAVRLRQAVLKRAFEGRLVGGVDPGTP